MNGPLRMNRLRASEHQERRKKRRASFVQVMEGRHKSH
jgi:hypothetical protein